VENELIEEFLEFHREVFSIIVNLS